jgi:hypothetical protein
MQIVPSGRQSNANCTRVAASRMQIYADFIHVACDWLPRGYNLHATGGHSGTICMRLPASRMQILHALAASTVHSCQFFARTLREQLFELKNQDVIKKSENLCGMCFANVYPLTLCMARSNLVRQFH